ISSQMGSLQTDDERMKQDLEGVRMLVGNYIAAGAWAGLDDPAVKEAKIAGLIKIQEKTKEVNKKIGEVEKEKSLSSNCTASAPNTKGAEGELKVTRGIIYGSRVGAECEQSWVYYTGGLLKKLVKEDKPPGWYRQEEYAKIMTPAIQAIGILNGDIRAIDKETYRKGSLFTLEKLFEQNPSDQFITSISPYYKSICKELDLQLSGSGMLEPVYIEFDLVLMFTSIGELKAAFNLARAGGLFTRSVAKGGGNIALGVREGLGSFAKKVGGSTWETWGTKNFQTQFLETINNSANKIHFNLDGVGNVWKAVTDGAKGFGKSQHVTSWELHQIYSNPSVLKRTTFYLNGKVVPSPF
ncbi:MAG: hypothetical protein WBP45_11490, partial [Daejeonella sp.]